MAFFKFYGKYRRPRILFRQMVNGHQSVFRQNDPIDNLPKIAFLPVISALYFILPFLPELANVYIHRLCYRPLNPQRQNLLRQQGTVSVGLSAPATNSTTIFTTM